MQSLGAALLFTTNVAAILASGIVVMAVYRVGRASDQLAAPTFRRGGANILIGALLAAVIFPLWLNSDRVSRTIARRSEVQAVAEKWAGGAGWSVVGVTSIGNHFFVDVTGPNPSPDLSALRTQLNDDGLGDLDIRVALLAARYTPVTR